MATAGPRGLADRLVGRDDELATLVRLLGDAGTGRGGVAFVVGEPGIGKSCLVQAVAAEAQHRGMRVVQGRAVPTAAPAPYRPIAEALSAASRAGVAPDSPTLEPFRAALSRLVPDWHDPVLPTPDESAMVLAEGVLRLLGSRSSAGTLLVLEDLHWADAETLAVVEYLADNLAGEPVLCVATARDESTPAQSLALTLHARRQAAMVELNRLPASDVAVLLDACLGDEPRPPELATLASRAEGVPFLVEELLAVAMASGALIHDADGWRFDPTAALVVPLTFADGVRRRLEALPGEARDVLGAAAVLGRRFEWELLPDICGLDDGIVSYALRAAVAGQLLGLDDAGMFRFRHALTREAVLADLLPPERARLSERALVAIEKRHPGLPGTWCELAADVAEHAGDRSRAADLLLDAGRRAANAGALVTAEATLERARTLVPDDRDLLVAIEELLTTVLALAGRRERAEIIGHAVLDRLGTDPSFGARRAEINLALARAAIGTQRWEEADLHLSMAAEDAGDDPALRARIEVLEAHVAILRAPGDAVALARAALEIAEREGLHETAAEALEIIGRFERGRDLDAAEAAFRRAHELAVANGLRVWEMRALHELGTVDLLRDGSVDRLEEARRLSVELGAPSTTAVLDVQLGATLTIFADPEPGLAAARRAVDLARRFHLDQLLTAGLAFEAVGLARTGALTDAEARIAEATALGAGNAENDFNLAWARAHVALMVDDRAAAAAALRPHTVEASQAIGVQSTGPNAALLALLIAGDEPDDAERWLANPPQHVLARGLAAFAEATLAGGRGADWATPFERAEQILFPMPWYRHLGCRLVAEAAINGGWGRPHEWLAEALVYFADRGDDRLASACRSLLRRAGAPVPRRRSARADDEELAGLGITEREAEVLDLLADGLPNHAIADRLFMSTRTAERHVANLTVKTGVDGRAALIAFAARRRQGLPTA